ncbi:MAG: hypothetical protein ACOYLX_19710, partial [Burkholderiaceae bacterium]
MTTESPVPATPAEPTPGPTGPPVETEDEALPLPGTRPRVGLPLHLPAAAVAAVVIAHLGVAGFFLLGADAEPSPTFIVLVSAAVGMVVSGGTMWAVGGWLGRRIVRIIEVLERTQVGDYTQRVEAGLHDDVGMLARRVNLLVSTSAAREKRIMESALSDPLTGLPNRTLLTERIRHSLAMSRRSRAPFAVSVIDR